MKNSTDEKINSVIKKIKESTDCLYLDAPDWLRHNQPVLIYSEELREKIIQRLMEEGISNV